MAEEINYEEKCKALEAELAKQKSAMDKACSEAAEWKTKYRDTMTEAEKAEAERAERDKARDAELQGYRDRARVADYRAKLVGCGYDAESADKLATLLPEGVGDDFFATTQAVFGAKAKEAEAKLLNKQPPILGGETPTPDKLADAEKMQMRKWAGLR